MTAQTTPDVHAPHDAPAAAQARRRAGKGVWAAVRAAVGAGLGVVPHVSHHVGLLAGTALLTGAAGNTVLYVTGLLLSIPLLRRLRRRFGTWLAPGLGVLAFTAMFAFSAVVLGPAISGESAEAPPVAPTPTVFPDTHASHHD